MAKINLPPITTGAYSNVSLNNRFQQIEDALNDGVLWRENPAGEPNAMSNPLDMADNKILNLSDAEFDHEAVNLGQVEQIVRDEVDELIGGLQRTVRTPEEIPALPSAAQRANRLLEFDHEGNPTVAEAGGPNTYPASGITITPVPTLSSDNVQSALTEIAETRVQTVATIADLRDIEPISNQQIEVVRHSAGAFGGGLFYADLGDTASPDDNGLVIVTNGGARWKRRVDALVTPEMFGAVGDGVAYDTTALQAWLNCGVGLTTHRGRRYRSGALTIYQPVFLVGASYGVDPAGGAQTDDASAIVFDGIPPGETALTIGDATHRIYGSVISGMDLLSTSANVDGIKINGSLAAAVQDCAFRDIKLLGFRWGLVSRYGICNEYSNVRWQSCANGLDLGNQTNANIFNKCSIVSIADQAIRLTNAEGLQFNTCNISNLTKSDGAPINTFQSSAIFVNSYFENIDNPELMLVGRGSEVIPSSVVIDHPLKLGGDVQVRTGTFAEIRGGSRDMGQIVPVGPLSAPAFAQSSSIPESAIHAGDLVDCGGSHTFLVLPSYTGGASLVRTPYRGYTKIVNSGSVGSGCVLSTALEPGELYTLFLAIRDGGGGFSSVPSLRIGNLTPMVIPYSASGSPAKIERIIFRADDANLRLLFVGDLDIFGFAILLGSNHPCPESIFYTAPTSAQDIYVGTSTAAPTVGAWRTGDRLYNRTPTSGNAMGWVCTAGGSPGTWVAMPSL